MTLSRADVSALVEAGLDDGYFFQDIVNWIRLEDGCNLLTAADMAASAAAQLAASREDALALATRLKTEFSRYANLKIPAITSDKRSY